MEVAWREGRRYRRHLRAVVPETPASLPLRERG